MHLLMVEAIRKGYQYLTYDAFLSLDNLRPGTFILKSYTC